MKKRAFTFILLCLAIGLSTTALAQTQYHTATVNGITWTYKLIGNNAAIVSPGAASNGPSEYSSWYDATWTSHLGTYTGVIKIPAELDGHPVTTISGGAFDGSSAKGYILIMCSVHLHTGITAEQKRANFSASFNGDYLVVSQEFATLHTHTHTHTQCSHLL